MQITSLEVTLDFLVRKILTSELHKRFHLILDGKVISHCSSNTHDFLYPAIPPYYGSGREILLYKTAKFKPIRVTVSTLEISLEISTIFLWQLNTWNLYCLWPLNMWNLYSLAAKSKKKKNTVFLNLLLGRTCQIGVFNKNSDKRSFRLWHHGEFIIFLQSWWK